MTVTTYDMQRAAELLSADACRGFEEGSIEGIGQGLVLSIASRAVSLLALSFSSTTFAKTPVKVFRSVYKIFDDEFSGRALIRVAIAISCVALLAFGRLIVSACGVISPEITYGYLRMQEHVLWLGLYCRAQTHAFPEHVSEMIDRVGDQRARLNIVGAAIRLLKGAEAVDTEEDGISLQFTDRIWRLAIRTVEEDHAMPDAFEFSRAILGRAPVIALPADRYLPPPDPDELAAYMGAGGHPFLGSVVVPHPIYSAFFQQLATSMHNAVIQLDREEIFSREELEDGVTALFAVENIGLLDLIENHCSLSGSVVNFDHEALTFRNAGRLFGFREGGDQAQVLARLRVLYERIPSEEKGRIRYYLCADETRVAAKRGKLPPMGREMREFFNDLVAYRTRFVEKEMGGFSGLFTNVYQITPL